MRATLAAAVLAALALAGCFEESNYLVVKNRLDEATWVDVRADRADGKGEAWRANVTVPAGAEERVELGRLWYRELNVTARSPAGAATFDYQAGCGAACYLMLDVGREGLVFSTLHAD